MNAPLAAVLICVASQAAAQTPCERAAFAEPQAPHMVMTSTNASQGPSLLRGAHAQERTPIRADAAVRYGADPRSVYAAPHEGTRQRSFTRQDSEESGGTDVRLLVVGLALMAGIALRRLGSGPR